MGGRKGGNQGPVLTICVSSREELRPNKRESPHLSSPVVALLRPCLPCLAIGPCLLRSANLGFQGFHSLVERGQSGWIGHSLGFPSHLECK